MLEHLFGSRTRVKLLQLFLRESEEPVFVREITRRISTQINAVRRELANLVSLGLIIEVEDAGPAEPEEGEEANKPSATRRKYYKVNPNFRLLAEIRALIAKSRLLLERRIDKEIAKFGDVRYLAIMGRLTGLPNSPVDLFLVGTLDKKLFHALMVELEKELGFEINFSLMTWDEYNYRREMLDRFLISIMEAPKTVLIDRLK